MKKIKPKRLQQGDTIGIVAPASGVFNPSVVHFGQRLLESLGYSVKLGAAVYKRHAYLAGTDEERVADLHHMFAQEEVAAIMCLRGGYGTLRLLEQLDWDLIKRNPKIFIGFSDITALHLAIYQKTGLVTFHGPVLNSLVGAKADYSKDHLLGLITDHRPAGQLTNPLAGASTFAIYPGKASGELIGGNLSMVCATLGTAFEIDTKDKIFFLEEVGEEPYRIDRMLTQLLLTGKFQQVKAVIFGESIACTPGRLEPSFSCSFSLEEVLMERLQPLKVPVLYNLSCGHGHDQLTLPIGIAATLDADRGTLTIREGSVIY